MFNAKNYTEEETDEICKTKVINNNNNNINYFYLVHK